MSVVAEQDKAHMAKLADEASNLRSHEAHMLALEIAYALGRRTGFREAGEMARTSLSEGKDHG